MFIAFEGIDGSGKSTQSTLLYKNLERVGYPTFHTRPAGRIPSRIMSTIKQITHDPKHVPLIEIEAEAMLYMTQTAQATAELIIPHLNNGEIVVTDRFVYSVYALCHWGRGVDLNLLKAIGEFVTRGLTPDIVFLTDVPAKLAFARKERDKKTLGRKELMAPDFFEKVRQGFLEMAKEDLNRWLVVDDEKLSVKEAEKAIWDYVSQRLPKR